MSMPELRLTPRVTPRAVRRLEADGHGGTAEAIIDLARPHPEGGYDPEARQIFTPLRVSGRFRTGHTADLSNPAAPIFVREADDIAPGSVPYVEGRCPRCIAKVTILRDDDEAIMVLEHQAGCAQLAALAAEAASL